MVSAETPRVVFSTDAFNTIITETLHKHPDETGGILLGQDDGSMWYVIECIEPGPAAIFRPHYFEYDHDFVNYVARARARRYRIPLKLLGLWHRHPGSFDRFSSTDDETNRAFAGKRSPGAISGLVNIDPNFRFTLYHFDATLKYRKTEYEVSDEGIPASYLMKRFTGKKYMEAIGNELKNPEKPLPEELLDILLYENELLLKQRLYTCSFRYEGEVVLYDCHLKGKLIGKSLPENIHWKLTGTSGHYSIETVDGKDIPYTKGCFLEYINRKSGLSH